MNYFQLCHQQLLIVFKNQYKILVLIIINKTKYINQIMMITLFFLINYN